MGLPSVWTLECSLRSAGHSRGEILNAQKANHSPHSDVIDFDLCWAFDLADPWGNLYELNCYDYERVPHPFG